MLKNYNPKTLFSKVIFFFFLIFILFFLTLPLKAEILLSKYELNLTQEGLLKGKAYFVYDKEGFYVFFKKELSIFEVRAGEKRLKLYEGENKDSFKVYLPKEERLLEITFERPLAVKESLFPEVVENYLPYPETLTLYEITLNATKPFLEKLFIPHEAIEVQEDGRINYKIFYPLRTPPPLIFKSSSLKLKILSLGEKEIYIYFQQAKEKALERSSSRILGLLREFESKGLPLPFKKLFLINFPYEKPLPLTVFIKDLEDPKKLEASLLRGVSEQILLYSLNLKEELYLRALKVYLSEYLFAKDKRAFRKGLLLGENEEAKAFFFFYEALRKNSLEETFLQTFKNYYEKFLSNTTAGPSFEGFLKRTLNLDPEEFKGFEKVSLSVKDVEVIEGERGKRYLLKFVLSEEGNFRPLDLILFIETASSKERRKIYLDEKLKVFQIEVSEKPEALVIDPDYEVFRTLQTKEILPAFSILKELTFKAYLPDKKSYPLYRDLIELLRENLKELSYTQPDLSALPKENLLFLDLPPKGYHFSFPQEGFYFKILPHPFSQGHFLVFVKNHSVKELSYFLKIHEQYKEALELWIKGKRVIFSSKAEKEQAGLKVKIEPKTSLGIRPSSLFQLEEIIPEFLASQVILIGESHDQYGHHRFQLEVIKELTKYYQELAIGLEMVQSPFQKYLDEFIEGKIDEKAFLEKIEYYERWGFDYRLYRDIFLFARENKIKLLALDLPSELVKKVSREGLTNLTQAEVSLLPELDLERPDYRRFMEKIYKEHQFKENGTTFENFFKAQVLRDEAMAEKVVEFLRKNPSYKMVVLVGKGHLLYGYGIPDSLKRRNFYQFKTIILGEVGEKNPFLGDYWFFPPSFEFEGSPRLGVSLEEVKEGLKIKEVIKKGPAEKAGLKEGDVILKVDGRPVKKVSDLKLILTFKNYGERVKLEILREEKTLEFEVMLTKDR